MRVGFKNDSRTFECSEPVEQKLYKAGVPQSIEAGWVMSFQFYGDIDSAEVDRTLTSENISEITFTPEDGKSQFTATGYTKMTSCIIKHKEIMTTVEVQFTKMIKEKEAEA